MKAEMNTLNCGRENDLVSFLYGELGATDKLSFQRHMQECVECSSQLSTFSDLRQSVVNWRNESLGALTPPLEHRAVARMDRRRPSAIAAIREFFNLSPLWLKGTVAFASLLFCLFAFLAAARLMETTPETIVVNKTDSHRSSAQELNAEVERRVKEELQRRETVQKESTVITANSSGVDSVRRPLNRNSQLASAPQQQNAGRPLSKVERQELAADLRLIADDGDGQLVLIGDRINQ
jgi:anti-sigma factor RsiW